MTSAHSTTPPGPEFPAAGMRLSEAPMAADAPDDPTVAVIRRFLTAVDNDDRATARDLLAPEVRWVVPGRSAVAGTHVGPDAVLDVDATMRRLSGGTLRHHVLIWLAAAPHAHAVARQTATRDGHDTAFDRAFVFTLDGAGLITDVHAYTDDLYAFDEFWH